VIGLTKLLLEVALLGQDNSAMYSDKEREEHDNAYHLLNIKTSLKCRNVSAT